MKILRLAFSLLALTYVLTHFFGVAHAQGSLGVGAAEAAPPAFGPLAGLMQWVNAWQQDFYRSLTGALKDLRDEGGQPWLLVGLSFAYGVFHAAGPGHGKAVISSYMLANEVALRRGVLLSFLSAGLQAVSALAMIGLTFLVLRGASVSMADATRFLEISSYALVAAFGAWLLWKKARPIFLQPAVPAYGLSAARAGHGLIHAHAHHHHAPGETCASCGHSHAPDPSLISGERFGWRSAWSAVAAVGLRPCSGALIVLTFAFLNGLWAGGVLSVFAMALGTAVTVSLLAVLAVAAKNWAVALSGGGRAGARIHLAIEIAGAALILLLGLTLLGASLAG